jgi:hypothetical protein
MGGLTKTGIRIDAAIILATMRAAGGVARHLLQIGDQQLAKRAGTSPRRAERHLIRKPAASISQHRKSGKLCSFDRRSRHSPNSIPYFPRLGSVRIFH